MHAATVRTVAICDTEPIAIEGLRAMLEPVEDLQVVGAETSLISAMDIVREYSPSLVLIDKAFGIHAVMDWTRRVRGAGTSALVWGVSVSAGEAMRIVQAGALGVVRKSAELPALLKALRTVAAGNTWMEECFLRESDRSVRGHRSNLTGRELQVLELVEQGMRNKDIASTLGIQAGTVKIHLKHIFEKTGIRGRYGLALTGLREKGLLSLPTM